MRLLRQIFGNHRLATSAAFVARQAVGLREDFDEERVAELANAHLMTWDAYDEIIIRRRDRIRRGASAIRVARAQVLVKWPHDMRTAAVGYDSETPPVYRPNPLLTGSGIDTTFGLAYATTLTLVHMSTTSGRDPDEVLREYRATAAGEYALPPEVTRRHSARHGRQRSIQHASREHPPDPGKNSA